MIKKILSASVIYAIAPQLPKLVSLFMMPVITKHMTAEDYGITGIIMAYMAAIEAFKDLGLRVILTNSFFKYPTKYRIIWRKIHGIIQLWSIIYGMLLSILLSIIIPPQAANNYIYIAIFIIIPTIFFEPIVSIGREYFQLNKKPIPISILSVISGLVTILFSYIFIVVYHQGYIGVLTGLFASGCFNFIAYIYIVYIKQKLYPSFSFNRKWLLTKLKISLPTIPHYYAGYLLGVSDRVLQDLFKIPLREIGMYSFAYSIGTYFSIIGKSYLQASGPFLMEFYKKETTEGDKQARNISYIVQAFLITTAFILSIWSKELFNYLARNNDLKGTYIVSIWVIFSFCYYPSYNYNGMKLWYNEKTKLLMKISVVAALISVLLNIFLLPFFGYLGSAIATFISFLFMGYGGFIYSDIRILFKIKYNWWVWPLLTVSLLSVSLYIVDFNLQYKLFITSLFVVIVFILIIIYRKNLRLFHGN